MNDLMTKSFLSYVELKKQAQRDAAGDGFDIESGGQELNPMEEQNLSLFFEQVDEIKTQMEETTNLLVDIQKLNQEAKSTHNAKILRGLRDRIDSDMVSILRRARILKEKLASLDQSNTANRLMSVAYGEGTAVDRTRTSITKGLRVKLREMMNEFQGLREKVVADHKEDLRRRYFGANGEQPSEEQVEKIMSGSLKLETFEGTLRETELGDRVRHESVMDIQRSLNKLHQVFLDMAILVESEGEKMEDIEENVAKAGKFINGGTRSLYYANQMKRKNKKWVYWVWAIIFLILLVCIVSMLVC
ncbi:syntaxin-112 [Benincasa hispida]|uniref:syntaxin-112 n=1 Tax=Benincasa hispida TaxID=102211 RepID=UPI0018FF25B8|nr:syntaxin-112 [Benincasa hispida]XP_038883405.1 syntaxin-112 [Benincasa hispida]